MGTPGRSLPFRWVFCLSLTIFVIVVWEPVFAVFPEYEHFSDREARELNTPWLLDSEYQSDKLSYEFPIEWYQDWLSVDNAFQYSAGSLGPTRFLTRGRLKLNKDISERFFLRLAWLDRGDFENHRSSTIFEMGYRVLPNLSVNLYGQPASLKSEDDIGLATEWSFSPKSRLRLFHTWVDFSHNKRTEDQSIYRIKPRSYGFVWRHVGESGGFQELSLRHDTKMERQFGAVNRLSANQGLFLTSTGRYRLGPGADYLQVQVEAARLFEQDTLNTDRGIDTWEQDRLSLWVQHEQESQWLPLYGMRAAYSEWASPSGAVIHNSLSPHAWTSLFDWKDETLQHVGRLGYEMTWHRGQGNPSLRGINDVDDALEHRMNLRYEMVYSSNTRILFLLSFDMDDLAGAPWEGGNMQFSTDF